MTDEDVKKFMEIRKIDPFPRKFKEAHEAKLKAE